MQNYKTSRRQCRRRYVDNLESGDDFLDTTPKIWYIKEVIIWNSLKLKILLCERQYQETETTSHWSGHNICKRHFRLKTDAQNIQKTLNTQQK